MNFIEQVREYLKTADLRRATFYLCADDMGVTEGTFRRKIREQGTSFRKLKTQERQRRLRSHTGTNVQGKEIARDLGFISHNSFYRFHQREYGRNWSEARD